MNNKHLIALAAATCFSGQAQAWTQDRDGLVLQLDTKMSAGASWRVESRDRNLVGRGNGGLAFSTNGDDGNLAFDSGEVVSAAAKITSDLTISRGDFGVFVRGSYLFNERLNNYDFFDLGDYGVGKEAPISEYRAKTAAVRDQVGNDADLLDAYFFGSFNLAGRPAAFRIGRQVINWGESTFILHGINSILTFDQNQQRVPGFEIDELLLPTNMAWVSFSPFGSVSVEAFYQLDWESTTIDASGTYWSSNDFAGIGGTRANIGFGLPNENSPGSTIPREADREPGNDGQYGGKLGFSIPALNEMDLSLYAMNYHSRLPLISGVPKATFAEPSTVTGRYFVEYPEDIQLYGLSFNTAVGDWSIQGEYSYKVDQPLQIDDVEVLLAGVGLPSQLTPAPCPVLGCALGKPYLRGWRRHDVSQVDLGLTRLVGPIGWLGSDQLVLLAEAGGVYVHDLPPESQLRYDGPGTYTPGDPFAAGFVSAALGTTIPVQTDGYATDFSWGYKLVARLSYNNLIGPIRVEPTLRFDHDVKGVTPTPVTNFVEDRKMLQLSVSGFYLQEWSAELGYTRYFDGGNANLLGDRDFIDAVVKYSF
ncbi:MAG TPA: DUF1302 domain-containing protein [Solimonas sp.]|nr:DUF1302 domain-containing protein [Solimonas sp.]